MHFAASVFYHCVAAGRVGQMSAPYIIFSTITMIPVATKAKLSSTHAQDTCRLDRQVVRCDITLEQKAWKQR